MAEARQHPPRRRSRTSRSEPPEVATDGDAAGASVDAAELAKFAAMAESWWDPAGKFRPLHKLNPTRIAFVRDSLAARLGRDPLAPQPLRGLRLLDIGCGGGLLSEPMARLGAAVTGIDPTARNIGIARHHAEQSGLPIDYRVATAEDLAAGTERFDAILNMEVVEHVADLDAFVAACGGLLAEGGVMFVATINRTPKSFLFAIVGAEYVLRWLPRGTHDWRKFVRPSELAAAARRAGADVDRLTGVSYDPLRDRWNLSDDLDVNYMAVVTRGGG
jgi:2-polyprenyl-6-hydroxyphenyl methylase/3-demethylubiquinone-9 3-methyltransferase